MGGTVAEGGLGIEGADGAGGTMDPPAEGGLGIAGIEGGLGAEGAEGITVGGLRPTGAVGAPPGTGTGFGGRLIIAVSRGLEATGVPSRRAGRTILTVSFLGSAIICSEWVKQQLDAATKDIHKIFSPCQSKRAKLLHSLIPRYLRSKAPAARR